MVIGKGRKCENRARAGWTASLAWRDGSVVVFTRVARFACKCYRKVALLWIDSALGTVTHLVLLKSENCRWFTLKGERDSPLVVRMADAGPATEAIVAHWGCPDRMMRDSSFGVERLRIPRSRKSESAVAFAACSTCDPVIINSGRKSNPVKSFCIGDANGIPFSKASIRGPPGLLPAMHGHIEMFSMMPQRLYWLFDVPVSLGPFSSGHRRAAAFVTRIGISVQIWLVAIAEGGLAPFFDRQCNRAGSPVAGGLGHAMIIGAVACDISWREGRSSVFGVQEGSREVFPVSIVGVGDRTSLVGVVRACRGVCMGKVEACSHDAKGRTRLCRRLCSVARRDVCDHAMTLDCVGLKRS
ncbi:hypothetical protein CRG98_005855 [Punica granatum]|uniref:Uncharacterized protein n=1 Tax=Punica granatum TaxID=22663 RepID=A0A2I0KZ62_PUNGR|nr:hypothetical protein CRG98_005855 [Punica granatum]